MAQIAPQPFVLKDVLLTLGADAFEKQVSSVEFVPSASTVVWKGLNPAATFTDTTFATWVANLSFAQDWETVGSLSRFLFDSEGQTKVAVFKPKSGTGPSFTASLIVVPGSIGGAVDSTAVATVSLGCAGRPVLVPVGTGLPLIVSTDGAGGGIAGGTLVAIYGSNFLTAVPVTGVMFGTVNASSFKVVSDSLIMAVAPAQAAGSKPIKVTNAIGAGVTSPYTYA